MNTKKLLQTPLSKLKLSLEGTPIQACIDQVLGELEEKGLFFRPHFWLAEEFYCPEDIPGVGIPFYLADPKLMALEEKMMLEVEGRDPKQALRILRHEVGHAIEHAYYLYRKRNRIKVFGKSSEKYPDEFIPRPYSKSFVHNIAKGYGQSHPDEDFAETFAVWLDPKSNWRTKYRKWPAIKKLEFMDELMGSLKGKIPPNRSKAKVDPIHRIKKTLKQYYDKKRERFGLDQSFAVYDRDLKKLFVKSKGEPGEISAAEFLERNRKNIRKRVSYWTGQYRYAVDEVITEIIHRCKQINMVLMQDEDQSLRDALVMVSVMTMDHLHKGGFEVAL